MATLFRAAVMLSVLVGLPGAWIYYGPLPTGAQRVVDRFVAIAREATGWKESQPKSQPSWDFTKSAPIVGGNKVAAVTKAGENRTGEIQVGGGDAPARLEGIQVAATPFLPVRTATAAPLEIGKALPPADEPKPSPSSSLVERVEPLLTQLRQLGVAEYALERWGGDGKFYRFRCEMPIAGGALMQQFEAVAAEPEASVEQVVAEVSQWRLARQVGGM